MPDMGKRFSHHTNRENPLTPQTTHAVGVQLGLGEQPFNRTRISFS